MSAARPPFFFTALLLSLPLAAGSAQDSSHAVPAPPQVVSADSQAPVGPVKLPLRAVLEGVATNIFLNRVDAWVFNSYAPRDGYWARVTPETWSQNLRLGWVWDTDDFMTNVFLHPYHGATYFGFGRANGLDFWESTPLPFVGSLEWEYFAETTRPSLNDLYNTSFGGVVTGEVIHRLLALIRDNRATGLARVLRELAAVPLDLPGSVVRLLKGKGLRVYANPPDREPSHFGLRFQSGAQLVADSGGPNRRVLAGTALVDIDYGDPFAAPYAQPFDVFTARLRVGTKGEPVTEMRVEGRLFGHELTRPEADARWIFTVAQKMAYNATPAYRYGAQSLDVGFVNDFALSGGLDVRTAGYAEGIVMGAVDAPKGDTLDSRRTYDFGPGVGLDLAASLDARGIPLLTARWHVAYLHAVSGSSANHFVQFPSLEAVFPLSGTLGLGLYAGWYQRRSTYATRPGEEAAFPEYRVSLVWQSLGAGGARPPR